jgi:hypothetical protein
MKLHHILKSMVLFFAITLMISTSGHAQTAKPAATKPAAAKLPEKTATPAAETAAPAASSNLIKFNTDSESTSTEVRESFKFKVPGVDDKASGKAAAPGKPLSFDTLPEEEANFKAYIGYPRHQASVSLNPVSISSKFNSSVKNFNYETTTLAYELGYKFVATPLVSFEFNWTRYTVDVAAATGASVSPLTVSESEVDLDSVMGTATYCVVSGISFFQRLCPAITIGKDAYPVLEYEDNTTLFMSKVSDIVLGLSISYQIPISDRYNINSTLGYNSGTGVGNSGVLTSEANSNLYFRVANLYNWRQNHDVGVTLEYSARAAELEGKYTGGTKKWETEATTLGGKFSYTYTF